MTIHKLTSMPYAQAHVETDEIGNAHLFSYVTRVASIDIDEYGDRWLSIYGLYSMTTRKHISAFVREYADMDYNTAKQLYYDNMKLNLDSGEVVAI